MNKEQSTAQRMEAAFADVGQPVITHAKYLHNAIMNLTATPDKTARVNFQLAYKIGHREARHAAAELVIAAPQESAEPIELTDAEIIALAHRMATTYTHRSDPKVSSYAFMAHTLIPFVRSILAAQGASK